MPDGTAAQQLRALFEERDRVAADLADVDRRITAQLGPFGEEQRYQFRPSVEAARRALGFEV